MARSGIDGFILLHGARSENELYYRSTFRRLAANYLPCVWDTPDGDIEYCERFHRKMVDLLVNHLKPGQYDFYLCGWRKMIKDVTLLIDESYPDSHVYTEVFY